MNASPSPLARLLRSALIGLALGLLAGAGYLVQGALRSPAPDCAELSPSECELVQDISRAHAKTQALVAFALALSGTAALLVVRGKKPQKESK